MNAENKNHALVFSIFLLFITGCSSNIYVSKQISDGKIYVETFTGTAGPVISSAIRIEFQKHDMLAPSEEAEYFLTGYSFFKFWYDGTGFDLRDKSGEIVMSGTAAANGYSTLKSFGNWLAKKIVKKIKVKSDVSR